MSSYYQTAVFRNDSDLHITFGFKSLMNLLWFDECLSDILRRFFTKNIL